jgi:hypothetical protein
MHISPGPSTCDEIMTTFNLDMLFKCTVLQHVTFKIQSMIYDIVSGQMEGLATYLENTSSV